MTDTTVETVESTETNETSFARVLINTVTINAAATAGTLIGLAAIGVAIDKVQKFRTTRAAKKAVENTDTTPEA